MARFIQRKINGEWVLVPVDSASHENPGLILVKGKFDAFQSPLDGSVISTQKQFSDHCKKHNVVPAQEFTDSFYADKARERQRFFAGEHSPAEKRQRKQEIYDNMTRSE